MTHCQISPRIILGIIVFIIGLLLLWKNWKGHLTDAPVLSGIAFILIGSHLIWIEADTTDNLLC